MKKIVFIITLLVSISGFSQTKSIEEKAKELTENMKSQINFSADKYDKVYAINLDFFKKTDSLKGNETSKIDKVKNLKKWDDERTKQLKEVLTPEEFKLFEENKSNNRKAFRDKNNFSKN